jgi:hypothetical protein
MRRGKTEMSDLSFSRTLLRWTLEDVSRYVPAERRKKAWVWTSDRRTWEFHFEDFFDCFHASDAYEARSKGWSNWLSSKGLPEGLGKEVKYPHYGTYVARHKAGYWSISAIRYCNDHNTSSAGYIDIKRQNGEWFLCDSVYHPPFYSKVICGGFRLMQEAASRGRKILIARDVLRHTRSQKTLVNVSEYQKGAA